MTTKIEDRFTPLQLESLKPLRPDVEDITSLSIDSLNRFYGRHIVQLSPRRRGMKLRIALGIADGTIKPSSAETEDTAA